MAWRVPRIAVFLFTTQKGTDGGKHHDGHVSLAEVDDLTYKTLTASGTSQANTRSPRAR